MIFVKDKLRFDTDKMELVSHRCYVENPYTTLVHNLVDCELYKSKKGNWLAVYEVANDIWCSIRMTEDQAIDLLLSYDIEAYERVFGELEEG